MLLTHFYAMLAIIVTHKRGCFFCKMQKNRVKMKKL